MKKKLKFRQLNDRYAIAHDRVNERYGLYNKETQNFDIPVIYKHLDANFENSPLLVAENSEGLYGYLDQDNEIVIPFQYEHARMFRDGFACISRFTDENGIGKSYEGMINEKGEMILPMEYEFIYSKHPNEYAIVKQNGKCGIITFDKKMILPLEFDYIEAFSSAMEEVFECTQNNKTGLYDIRAGKFIVPPELDGTEESFIIDGNPGYEYHIFKKNGLNALVKIQFGTLTFLTDYIYEHIDHTEMCEDRVLVSQDGLWGMTDIDGNLNIPCEYDHILPAQNGRIRAKKGRRNYILSLDGKVLEVI